MTSLFRFLKSWLLGSSTGQALDVEDRQPTPSEWEEAKSALEDQAIPACFGELGGFRPEDPANRFTSWWGGNFLAGRGEDIPTCASTGNTMLPIFQVRVDELPCIPETLSDIALFSLWFDPKTEFIWESTNNTGFAIRTYSTLDELVPLGPGYKEHETMPTFPIRWHKLQSDLPDWETMVEHIPTAVARSGQSDWFFAHPAQDARADLQSKMPIKIGGHSQWWQSPQIVEGGDFAFFLDSTERGSFGFPAGGNANFFRTKDSWEIRVDCT